MERMRLIDELQVCSAEFPMTTIFAFSVRVGFGLVEGVFGAKMGGLQRI